jgi:hypothetical protein
MQDSAEICDKMGLGCFVLRPELVQVGFVELMKIQTMCSGHSRSLLQRSFRSTRAAVANGFTRGRSGSHPIACWVHHINECIPLLVS